MQEVKKQPQEEAIELWENLQISNDFLFTKIMENPKICKRLLEIILEVPIERIEYLETEKTLKVTQDGKGIRLDIYVGDDTHTVYNVEMQATNTKELPKRSRYYQGVIDMDMIVAGQPYSELHTSYIIFICMFDLFGKGKYKYTFENRCMEDLDISLGDDTKKIFLNAKGFLEEANEDLQAFLEYVAGKESENDFVQELKKEAIKVKKDEGWRRNFMMQHMRDHLKMEEGKEIGKIEGESKLIALVRKKTKKSLEIAEIVDALELEVCYVEKVVRLIKEEPKKTDREIAEILLGNPS